MPQLLNQQAHSPTLDTILMIERAIRDAKEVLSIAQLKRLLPKQVHHYTLKTALTYLQESGKIEFTPNGVVWIFLPKEDITALLRKGRRWN